jgi:anti-sigma factor (TIGR02949 family)
VISCKDLLDELGDYLDEDLTPELRRELEKHLADCRPCKVVADSARMTVKIVTDCGSFELPRKMSAKIMAKVRAACSGKKGPAGESG